MTDLTEFVFSHIQKPESLCCDRKTLFLYHLMWCSEMPSVHKSITHSCWETLFASTLVSIFSNTETKLAFHISVCWSGESNVLAIHILFMQVQRTCAYPKSFFYHLYRIKASRYTPQEARYFFTELQPSQISSRLSVGVLSLSGVEINSYFSIGRETQSAI